MAENYFYWWVLMKVNLAKKRGVNRAMTDLLSIEAGFNSIFESLKTIDPDL
ncbi:MAG: hypothetical protein LUE93_16475 [Bacteroides sp.]|nr:hypothetical protein [Bacteroides sp.]